MTGPAFGRAGDVLIRELTAGNWTRLTAIVAFARMSGVRYVEPRLHAFVAGGGRVDLTVGTDLLGTSYETAWYLMKAVEPRGRLLLASAEPGATFHPKLFVFSNAPASDADAPRALCHATRALVLIGSSNLTGGGLFVNDEAGIAWRSDPADAPAWPSFMAALAPWLTPGDPSILAEATPAMLTSLLHSGRLPQELALPGARGPGTGAASATARRTRRRPPSAPRLVGPPPPAPQPPKMASPPGLSVLIAKTRFGGSRRWGQWELNKLVLDKFFGVTSAGITVDREPVTRSGTRLALYRGKTVIGVNQNRRLEFPDPDKRPDPGSQAALLVVVDRRPKPFRYTVLLPGDPEYAAVHTLNQSLPAVPRSVPTTRRVVVPYAVLKTAWPGCPL